MASQDSELIDYRQLGTLVFLGLEDFVSFLDDVSKDVPVHLERIQTAIREGNAETTKASAHSLRGMLANFGCIGMTSALHHLEYVMTPAPEEAAAIHAELDELWRKSLNAIDDWRRTVPEFATE